MLRITRGQREVFVAERERVFVADVVSQLERQMPREFGRSSGPSTISWIGACVEFLRRQGIYSQRDVYRFVCLIFACDPRPECLDAPDVVEALRTTKSVRARLRRLERCLRSESRAASRGGRDP